ncbi:uroporphyrinogen-III synthase [Bordetella genomosp. 1]|uniref:Uroporphyrinogen-III synthase n=1 Tax=Bordetella genomosp. 1 TaxID=1395607 RepID=A0ABX4EVJ5_9BORD|nr:uroporphyrinogen-III synthase [Bordetella genomosp. 1]OZI57816.1 uroporphyrinogen-III synthase [Bordetella genomosp. 1]
MVPLAILTRPDGRNEALADRLRGAGWEAHGWPALALEPVLAAADLPDPAGFDLVVFVSGNAARLFLERWRARGGVDWPAATAAATVGPASAAALYESGAFGANTTVLHPGAEAPTHDSEALWAILSQRPLPRRVLIVRGTRGREWLAERLRDVGAAVTPLAVYRRVPCLWDDARLAQIRDWAARDVRAHWLLTSAESIAAVRANIARADAGQWWSRGRAIITHPALAEALRVGGPGVAMVKECIPADEAIFAAFVAG